MIRLNVEKYKDSKLLETEYYINQVGTVLYSYEPKANTVHKTMKIDFGLVKLQVITDDGEEEMSIPDIIKEDNDIVKAVKPVCKTMKHSGYYIETNEQHLEIPHFNEYTNCLPFIKTMKKIGKLSNLPKEENELIPYIYKQLKTDYPYISFLIHNLFWQEREEVIVNFLSFLSVVGFKDQHQDIFYLYYKHKSLNTPL